MGVKTCLWLELGNKQWSRQVCSKNITAKFIACELLVKRVVTFGAVLYHNIPDFLLVSIKTSSHSCYLIAEIIRHMSRLTLSRELDVIVRKIPDPLRHKSIKNIANFSTVVCYSFSDRTFSFKILLHILGQTKRQILQRKIFCLHLKNTIITDIGFRVFIFSF